MKKGDPRLASTYRISAQAYAEAFKAQQAARRSAETATAKQEEAPVQPATPQGARFRL